MADPDAALANMENLMRRYEEMRATGKIDGGDSDDDGSDAEGDVPDDFDEGGGWVDDGSDDGSDDDDDLDDDDAQQEEATPRPGRLRAFAQASRGAAGASGGLRDVEATCVAVAEPGEGGA